MEEILATLEILFLNCSIKIIICIGKTQYPIKEERNHLIEEAHLSAIGGHKGVTETYCRIRQQYYWKYMKLKNLFSLKNMKYIQQYFNANLKN